MEKSCDLSCAFNFEWIFFIHADKKDNYKSLNNFEFRQDTMADDGLSCPWASLKLIDNVVTTHSSTLIFDWIFFIFAGDKDNHKISDGLEILPDQTFDFGVNYPWVSGKIPIDF